MDFLQKSKYDINVWQRALLLLRAQLVPPRRPQSLAQVAPYLSSNPLFKGCLAFPPTQVLLWPLVLEPPGVEGEPCDLAPPAHKLAHRCRGETKLDPWNGSRLSEIFIGRWQQLNPFSRSCLRQRTFSRWHKLKSQILVKKRCYEKAGNLKDLSRRNLRFHCSKYFLGLVCPLRSG